MIVGVGIDLVSIKRIKNIVARWDKLFLKKVFTEKEIKYCQGKKENCYQSYAGFFAAKEAFVKALGTGFRNIQWKEIEVRKGSGGKPIICLSDRLLKVTKNIKAGSIHLSISHTKELAVAQVIVES